jgi:hypothetical protein
VGAGLGGDVSVDGHAFHCENDWEWQIDRSHPSLIALAVSTILINQKVDPCIHYRNRSKPSHHHCLSSSTIVSTRLLKGDWHVTKVLDDIITCDPPFHCLIDQGALITGMSNYEVAKYLIINCLSMLMTIRFNIAPPILVPFHS